LTDEVISKHSIKEYPVCIGQNELCKQPDYIESNTFNQNEGSETHSRKFNHELFCVTEKDLNLIDINDLF